MNEQTKPVRSVVDSRQHDLAVLLATRGIHDAWIVSRPAPDGSSRVVTYAVPDGSVAHDILRDRLCRVAKDGTAAPVVFLARLPRDGEGAVDEAALAAVPVFDADALATWERKLRDAAGNDEVAAVLCPVQAVARRLSIADLLPGESAEIPAPAGASAAALSAVAPTARLASAAGPALVTPPDYPVTLAEALRRAAHGEGRMIYGASAGPETVLSYAQLRDQAAGILAGLRRADLRQGDMMLLQVPDIALYWSTFWACVLGGIVPVPAEVPPRYAADVVGAEKLRAVWDMLGRPPIAVARPQRDGLAAFADAGAMPGARIVVPAPAAGDGDLADGADDDGAAAVAPDDFAVVLLTSGSTGLPKAVPLSHRNILAMTAGVAQATGLGRGDVSFNWLPLEHVGPVTMFGAGPMALGMSQIHYPTAPIMERPALWLDLLDRHRVATSWAPNFAFALVNQAVDAAPERSWDLASLKVLVSGGEPVRRDVVEGFLQRLERFGLRPEALKPAFGMSETCSGITISLRHPLAADGTTSLGPPIPGSDVRIVGDDRAVLPEGAIGHIECRGPSVFGGYLGRPDLNAEAFVGGWFRCGDLGMLKDGELSVTGRSKDLIILNGAKFQCHEIEREVEQTGGVAIATTAAFAVAGEGGAAERLAILFCPDDDSDAAFVELDRAIRRRLIQSLGIVPHFLVAIPRAQVTRTAVGKIQRAPMQAAWAEGAFAEALARAQRLTGGAGTIPSWFHVPAWVPVAPTARDEAAFVAARSLLIADDSDFIAAFAALRPGMIVVVAGDRFAKTGTAGWQVRADSAADHATLFRDLAAAGMVFDTIVHARHWGAAPVTSESGAAARNLLALGQALAGLPPAQRPRDLVVASAGAQSVAPGDRLIADRATIPGFLRGMAGDIAGLRCRHVDLDDTRPAVAAARIAAETVARPVEPWTAYRSGRRLAFRWRALDPAGIGARSPAPVLRDRGVYLVAGGLGGIGRHLAEHLLVRNRARLLLIGRTPFAALDDERRAAYARLAACGEVAYEAVDAADGVALSGALDRHGLRDRLDGIVHAAGTGRSIPLGAETAAGIAETFRAKIAATDTLHDALGGRRGTAFIVIGSVTGMLGGAGTAAYAAANAWQMAFAAAAGDGPSRHFIGFSAWRDVGLSRGVVVPHIAAAEGLHMVDGAAGVASFAIALERGGGLHTIGLNGDHPRLRAQIAAAAVPLEQPCAFIGGADRAGRTTTLADVFGTAAAARIAAVAALPRGGDGAIDRSRLPALLAGTAHRPAISMPARALAEIWREILELGDEPGLGDDFFVMGGNSLLAAKLVARLRDYFGVDLPMARLFDDPTLAGMEHLLVSREARPGQTDRIAARLVEIAGMSAQQVAAALRARAPSP